MTKPTTRCDLHVHSSASVTTGTWFSKYFGCPESYADPIRQYELCKSRGMTLVTLTDHDTIEGGLVLLDRPDFFLSEEVSVKFPENGCVMHVLVWGLTASQHEEIQRLRENVYELSSYLRSVQLPHGLAHPMLSPNWRLDAETLEKCLVLFPVLETINGTVDRRTDGDVAHLLAGATPEVLATLSRKHGIPLAHGTDCTLKRAAGSDDHVGRRCGTAFTEAEGALDASTFLQRTLRGETRITGTSADLNSMAMCIQGTTYEYLRRRGEGSPFVDVVEQLAGRAPAARTGMSKVASALTERLRWASQAETPAAALELDITCPRPATDDADARFVRSVARTCDALLGKAVQDLGPSLLTLDIYGIIGALAEIGSALAALTPYLFAADHFARQVTQNARVWGGWTAFAPPAREEHLAVFSDSLDNIDGVASWCRRFQQQAHQAKRGVWFASCDVAANAGAEVDEALPAIARFDLPFYDGLVLVMPSLATTIDRLWRKRITHIELSTPGPMGLVGLAAARLLRLPVTATYHADLPGLVQALIGEPDAAALARGYVRWFYRSVDRTLATSIASKAKLVGMGVPGERVDLMPVAVDPQDFTPEWSSPRIFDELGVECGQRPVVLSVGRISPEKNIPLIIDAVERLQHRGRSAPMLVVVGDGPARAALDQQCQGKSFVRFVGFQEGETLRKLYASASVFVFASVVDTLGLVNLEALASGVPVLVPETAAIGDSLTDGETALFYRATPEALAETLRSVIEDPDRAACLSKNARQHALACWENGNFAQVWRALVPTPAVAHGAGPR